MTTPTRKEVKPRRIPDLVTTLQVAKFGADAVLNPSGGPRWTEADYERDDYLDAAEARMQVWREGGAR